MLDKDSDAPAEQPRTSPFAVASVVLGAAWLFWIGSALALVLGFEAKRRIAESDGAEGGEGLATAGIVLGVVGLAVLLLGFLALAVLTLTWHRGKPTP